MFPRTNTLKSVSVNCFRVLPSPRCPCASTGETPPPPGRLPDASVGEASHQICKKVNRSNNRHQAAAHYVRRFNMDLAVTALAEGIPWKLTRFDRSLKQHVVETVQPGPGCSAVLQSLNDVLPGGVSSAPMESRAATLPADGQRNGQFPGAARWTSVLWEAGSSGGNTGSWEARLATGSFRPDERTLLKAYKTYFGCDGSGAVDGECQDHRCPNCWINSSSLDKKDITCSRFKHGASLRASSGLGRWKGADVRQAASLAGATGDWYLGDGCGEDVEFFKKQPFDEDGTLDTRHLSLARILYFFEHRGNQRFGDLQRPVTSWVLAFDFVTEGAGTSRSVDPVTQHPVMVLRGRGRPVVFPSDAIRRHVHLYHRCPGLEHPPADNAWVCGPEASGPGGARVWRHKFRLSAPGNGGCDRFLLNEFHHSLNRDSIV